MSSYYRIIQGERYDERILERAEAYLISHNKNFFILGNKSIGHVIRYDEKKHKLYSIRDTLKFYLFDMDH